MKASSGVGKAAIMLIIVPKQLSSSPTITKQYDSTDIAETHFDVNLDGNDDIYAVGQYSGSAVNTEAQNGYQVKYNSTTRQVAAFNNGNGYTFVTYYLTGYDEGTNRNIYTVKFIYINGSPFTSSTNVSSLNMAAFAQGYYQLTTLEKIQALANDTTHNQIIYANNIGSIGNLSSVDIYDLTFARTVNPTTHAVTWGNAVYYSATIFNVNGLTINGNYNYLISGNTFAENSIYASEATTTQYVCSANGGRISKRTIAATYSNLNQSYRGALSAISINIANIEDLDNLPYSLTPEDKDQLIDDLNDELENASFSGDVLAATYADQTNPDRTKLSYTNGVYSAASEVFTVIKLTALSGTYSVTNNLAVSFTTGATLTLRYFKYDSTNNKYMIETFDDLLAIDRIEYAQIRLDSTSYAVDTYYTSSNDVYTLAENAFDANETYYVVSDYQQLNYIVTANLNGMGSMVTTFANVFNGTIEGANKVIRNFALVGSSSTGLFGTIASGASIANLTFVNVLAVAANDATISIVATNNEGTINNITVEAAIASDNNVTLKVFGAGTITSSLAVIETTKNITVEANVNTTEKPSTVILYRVYGLNGSVAFRLSEANEENRAAIVASAKAVMVTNRLNTPITITSEEVQINNFREYWVWLNLFNYLTASNTTTFIGYQFTL